MRKQAFRLASYNRISLLDRPYFWIGTRDKGLTSGDRTAGIVSQGLHITSFMARDGTVTTSTWTCKRWHISTYRVPSICPDILHKTTRHRYEDWLGHNYMQISTFYWSLRKACRRARPSTKESDQQKRKPWIPIWNDNRWSDMNIQQAHAPIPVAMKDWRKSHLSQVVCNNNSKDLLYMSSVREDHCKLRQMPRIKNTYENWPLLEVRKLHIQPARPALPLIDVKTNRFKDGVKAAVGVCKTRKSTELQKYLHWLGQEAHVRSIEDSATSRGNIIIITNEDRLICSSIFVLVVSRIPDILWQIETSARWRAEKEEGKDTSKGPNTSRHGKWRLSHFN